MNKMSLSTLLLTCLLTIFSNQLLADSPKITVINQVGSPIGIIIGSPNTPPYLIPSGGKFEISNHGSDLVVIVNGKEHVNLGKSISIHFPLSDVDEWVDFNSYQTDATLILTREGNKIKVTPS